MSDVEVKMLGEINSRLGNLEGSQEANVRAIGDMANSVNRLVDKLDKSDDVAKEALKSASSAHKRLNGHDKIFFWTATTIIGSLIVGGIALLWKGVGG